MRMTRWIVAAVVVSLVSPSVALAGDSILSSAHRIARETVQKDPTVVQSVTQAPPDRQVVRAQEQGGLFTNPDRSSRMKMLVGIGAAVAFVGSIWTIAKNSEDVTPSTLGTRQDGCCFK